MDWAVIILNELRHLSAVVIAELLLALSALKKRGRFPLRVALCSLVCAAVCVLYAVLYKFAMPYMIPISIVWYSVIFLLTGVFIAVCFEFNLTLLLWIMIAAYAAEHFVYVLVNEIIFIGALGLDIFRDGGATFYVMLLCNAAVCAGVYYALFCVFRNNIRAVGGHTVGDGVANRIFFGVFAAMFFASTLLNQHNTENSAEKLNYVAAASDMINCLFVLVVQYITLRTIRVNAEKRFADKLLSDAKKQYEAFRNSVDYVNIKCHDLKHEINALRKSGGINAEKVGEIAKGVELYEAFAHTGNETLDVLLTEKNLACINSGITLLYMVDGAALAGMDESDIYSLFGNLLDNAIEHVKDIADADKRFIRLFVKPSGGGMLVIHEENVLACETAVEDGLPLTTKADRYNHGFGTKSMRRTAKKYGGDLRVTVDDGMFKADIILQI